MNTNEQLTKCQDECAQLRNALADARWRIATLLPVDQDCVTPLDRAVLGRIDSMLGIPSPPRIKSSWVRFQVSMFFPVSGKMEEAIAVVPEQFAHFVFSEVKFSSGL